MAYGEGLFEHDNEGAEQIGKGLLRRQGNSKAAVENQGSIVSNNGSVILLGHAVKNSGTIKADGGTAALAAGSDITLQFQNNNRISVVVSQNQLNALASRDYKTREKACQQLTARKLEAVEPLTKLASDGTSEESIRAFEVLRRIYREGNKDVHEAIESAMELLSGQCTGLHLCVHRCRRVGSKIQHL